MITKPYKPYFKPRKKETTLLRVPKEFERVTQAQAGLLGISRTDYLRKLSKKLKPTEEDFKTALQDLEDNNELYE